MITIATSLDGISLTVVGAKGDVVVTFPKARVPWRMVEQQLSDSKFVRPDSSGDGCEVVIPSNHQLLQVCRNLAAQTEVDSDATTGLVFALCEACLRAGREIGRAEANAAARPMRGDGPLPQADLGVNPERSPQYR
jgi:hypothetical protein